jgi:hypothetical protein
LALSAVVAASAVVLAVGWALPNIAGPAFVRVRAVASAAANSGDGTAVAIGSAPSVRATSVNVTVELENRYPLAVVLGADPIAFKAAVYSHDASGRWILAWQAGAGDAAVEEGSDSPIGGGSASGAAAVPSGLSRHSIASGTAAFSLVDARGLSIGPGVYYLRVWGYGIGSPLLALNVGGGTDPWGPPRDLPPAPN